MEWKLETFKIKTAEAMLWENIMSTLAEDFNRAKKQYAHKIRKVDRGKTSYSRFKSRIVKRLRSEITVASSPLATRWQQSFNREFDTVCQRLPLDLSPTPENSSDSEQTLGELETTLTTQVSPDKPKQHSYLQPGIVPPPAACQGTNPTADNENKQEVSLKLGDEKKRAPDNTPGLCEGSAYKASADRPHPIQSSPVNSDCTLPELEMKLDITGLRDDYYLNLLDWNSKNLVAVALNSSTYMWNAKTHKTLGGIHFNSDTKYVSSVAWINHGNCLAIGTSDGEVQLWDVETKKRLRNMLGHQSVVGALSWNNYILSSGSHLGLIHHHDVRIARHHVGTHRHQKSICGLKWSPNGGRLASGSSDGLLNIWPSDPGMTVRSQPLQTMAHPTAVKAMDWCPWQSELVAVGGGMKDGVLRIWDTNTGSCIKSTHTNSQICSLLWAKETKELITGHGLPKNLIVRWDFPSITKIAELHGHKGRVLNLALSPDGRQFFSAAADGTACVWRSKDSEDTYQEQGTEKSD
ncbi:cell division cycle protein 20 homolog B-like [Acipenser ruthenus]|uniref:cell division cycle protein 20 homolog B-like n=1 Tax=Acipenser ruthenus TaxID=7906 RepID=UPI002742843B|nr:cell division cycle protein 20 homolog B-like [Acipenser ruthenus]